MYKRIRISVVYTCMVVSFLQLGSCSSHHNMYAGGGDTDGIALNLSDENSAGEKVIGDDQALFHEEVERLGNRFVVNSVLSVTVIASMGCLWWWCLSLPQASDNTNNVIMGIDNVTKILDNLKSRMARIENFRNLTMHYLPTLKNIDKRLFMMEFLFNWYNTD